MNRQMFNVGIVAALLVASGLILNANRLSADDKGAKPGVAKAAQKEGALPRILETVDLAPGKSISPQDQVKVSSLALKLLRHVSVAQQDIQGKKIDDAKKELVQAGALVHVLKEILPTVKIIDHIWVAKTSLSYLNTTEVQQDLITISASVDQLYDVLPDGKAKEHCKAAKNCLAKEKQKGASKAKEELEAVEESLDFRELDLSVSYTSRLVEAAEGDLNAGKIKEASEALSAVADGIVFIDATVTNPVDVAVRRIWMATQDYAGKDYKTATTRLKMAKAALLEVAQIDDKAMQAGAKELMGKIDAIDVSKPGDKTGPALEALWQDARKLVDQPQPAAKGKK